MLEFLKNPEIQKLTAEILTGILQLAIIVVGGMVVKFFKAKVSQQQLEFAMNIANVAVQAAEQLAAAGKIEYARKFETAIALARNQAKKWGFNFTDDQWKGFIEAAVKSMKELGEELWPPPDDEEDEEFDEGEDPEEGVQPTPS